MKVFELKEQIYWYTLYEKSSDRLLGTKNRKIGGRE